MEQNRHEDKNSSNMESTIHLQRFHSIISDTNVMSTDMSLSFVPEISFSWENLSLNMKGSFCKARMLSPSLSSMHKESTLLGHSNGLLSLQEDILYKLDLLS